MSEQNEIKEVIEAETVKDVVKKKCDVTTPIKIAAVTVACAGLGVIGGIWIVTAAAAAEIVLPAALCLNVGGITGGALGLVFGIGKKKENK